MAEAFGCDGVVELDGAGACSHELARRVVVFANPRRLEDVATAMASAPVGIVLQDPRRVLDTPADLDRKLATQDAWFLMVRGWTPTTKRGVSSSTSSSV